MHAEAPRRDPLKHRADLEVEGYGRPKLQAPRGMPLLRPLLLARQLRGLVLKPSWRRGAGGRCAGQRVADKAGRGPAIPLMLGPSTLQAAGHAAVQIWCDPLTAPVRALVGSKLRLWRIPLAAAAVRQTAAAPCTGSTSHSPPQLAWHRWKALRMRGGQSAGTSTHCTPGMRGQTLSGS